MRTSLVVVGRTGVCAPHRAFRRKSLFVQRKHVIPFTRPRTNRRILSTGNTCTLPNLISVRFRNTVNGSFYSKARRTVRALTSFRTDGNILTVYPTAVAFSRRVLGNIVSTTTTRQGNGNTSLINVGVRNPFVDPGGINTRGPRCLRPTSIKVFHHLRGHTGNLVGLISITPRRPNTLRFVQRYYKRIHVSVTRAYADCSATYTTFSTNTARVARLCGTVPNVARHRPNPVVTTLRHNTRIRLVASGIRVRPTVIHFAFHAFNSSRIVLVTSDVVTYNLPSKRCDLNKRTIAIGNPHTALARRPNAVTKDTAYLCSYVGQTILRVNIPLRDTIHTTDRGPTQDVNVSGSCNDLDTKQCNGIVLTSRTLGVRTIIRGKAHVM